MVSAETMYSSINTIHGPICTRPAATSAAIRASACGRTSK